MNPTLERLSGYFKGINDVGNESRRALFSIGFSLSLLLTAIAGMSLLGEVIGFSAHDDIYMMMILSGISQVTEPSPYILYSNIILGWVLKSLYEIWGDFPWYGLFHVSCIGWGLAGFSYAIFCERVSPWKALFLAMTSCIYVTGIVMQLQFTATAIFVCLGGILMIASVLKLNAQEKNFDRFQYLRLYSGIAMLILGSLIRLDSFYLALLLLLPLLSYYAVLNIADKRYIAPLAACIALAAWSFRSEAYWASLALLIPLAWSIRKEGIFRRGKWPLAAGVAVMFGFYQLTVVVNHRAYQEVPRWREWSQLNVLKSEFIDYSTVRLNRGTVEHFRHVEWTPNDFRAMLSWYYFDEDVFSVERLTYLVKNARQLELGEYERLGKKLWKRAFLFFEAATGKIAFQPDPSGVRAYEGLDRSPFRIGIAPFLSLGLATPGKYGSWFSELPKLNPLFLYFFASTVLLGMFGARSRFTNLISIAGVYWILGVGVGIVYEYLRITPMIMSAMFFTPAFAQIFLLKDEWRPRALREWLPRTAYGVVLGAAFLGTCHAGQEVIKSFQITKQERLNALVRTAIEHIDPQPNDLYMIYGRSLFYTSTLPFEDQGYLQNFNVVDTSPMMRTPHQKKLLERLGIDNASEGLIDNERFFLMIGEGDKPTMKTFIQEHYHKTVSFWPVYKSRTDFLELTETDPSLFEDLGELSDVKSLMWRPSSELNLNVFRVVTREVRQKLDQAANELRRQQDSGT